MRKVGKTDKGRLNKIINDLIHPYFKQYPALIIVDGLLHAMGEQNPDVCLKKFIKYNVPKIIKTLATKIDPYLILSSIDSSFKINSRNIQWWRKQAQEQNKSNALYYIQLFIAANIMYYG